MNNKILCVDDEEAILRGFTLNLRNKFDLHLASDGKEGLELFQREGGFAVVLSDMRMPNMNGAEMLAKIKQLDNEVVTVLLTGHTDFESAMAAVNEGNVFRAFQALSSRNFKKSIKRCYRAIPPDYK